MGAVVAALSWELFARHRLLFLLTGGWLALLCVLGLLLPEAVRSPNVGVGLALALAAPLLWVIAALTHTYDARLEERQSWFPVRLFTLPAPTLVLVGPPLVLGTLISVVCWAACCLCMLRGFGMEAPLIWPALCRRRDNRLASSVGLVALSLTLAASRVSGLRFARARWGDQSADPLASQ